MIPDAVLGTLMVDYSHKNKSRNLGECVEQDLPLWLDLYPASPLTFPGSGVQ